MMLLKARGLMSHRIPPQLLLLALWAGSVSLWAQTATLRGVVTDPSGAVVPKAAVTLKGPGGLDKMTVTADNGSCAFAELPAGNYAVSASAPELTLPQPRRVSLRGGLETSSASGRFAIGTGDRRG